MKNNGNDPQILRHALLSILGAMSSYYEDERDMPYERLKSLTSEINDKFSLNIDVSAIFIDKEDIVLDEGCLHDQNEGYFERIMNEEDWKDSFDKL